MRVARGTDRIAFVGEKHTVKVAKTRPALFSKEVHRQLERGGVKGVVNSWNRFNPDQLGSLKHMLLHGIAANRREARLAKQFGAVVAPTISLLGGVANIQPTAQSTGLDHTDVHSSFVDHIGHRVTALGHMLENPENLGITAGGVRFIDGASLGLERLLIERPGDIEQALGSVAAKAASI